MCSRNWLVIRSLHWCRWDEISYLAVTGLREILRDAWAITYRYWQSEDSVGRMRLSIAVLLLNLGTVHIINVLLNKMEEHLL